MPLFAELIGSAAAFCTTVAFLPQIVHIVKTRNTSGISLGMYSIFIVGVLLWLFYGIFMQSLPIIVANAVTSILAGTVLGIKVKAVVEKNRRT